MRNVHLLLVTGALVLALTSLAQAGINVTGDVTPGDPTTWTSSTHAYVGNTGTGSVTVDDDSDVVADFSYLGYAPGSMGAGTISGAGSTWASSNELYVGCSGDGTLEVTNGGVVSSDVYGSIGLYASSTGAVTVSGTGSTWRNSGGFEVGFRGNGTLDITDGGAVNNTAGFIGRISGSTGAVTVSGVGSTWANSNNLSVGLYGDGTLAITNGGLVSVAQGLAIDYDGGGAVDCSIDMATGGMLALQGNADDSLGDFLGLIGGTDPIRYWDDSISTWADIAGATYGDDYTLNYLTEGDLAGYTVLTVGVPEPATLALLALGGLALIRRKR